MIKFSKIKNCFIAILIGFTLFFTITPALAAETFFQSGSNEVVAGQLIKIDFFLNAENQNINALEGNIIFCPCSLNLNKINDGSSIINFWVKKPQIESDGRIIFSGAVPGGFSGSDGFLFSLTFQTRGAESESDTSYPQNSEINSQSVRAFLNDGKGTEINISPSGFNFTVCDVCEKSQENASEDITVLNKDNNPPEVFAPYIIKNPEILDGQWALVYYAQDKESGISHYEVSETKDKLDLNKNNEKNVSWAITDGPYSLKDQELKNYVYVKAVDKAGNERIAMVLPQKSEKYSHYIYIKSCAIIAAIVLLAAAFVFICRCRSKISKSDEYHK